MLAHHIVPVILRLPGVHDALLGQVCGRAITEVGAGILKDHVSKSLVQLVGSGHGVGAVAAKLYVQTAIRHTRLITHVGSEIVGPTGENGLGQGRFVEWIAGSCTLGSVIEVEERVAVVNVPTYDRVAAKRQVSADVKVINVVRRREQTS